MVPARPIQVKEVAVARFSNGETVLSRVIRLVEAVADNDFPLSVSELSQRTGLPLPTVSRTVSELVEREWLRRDMTRRVDIGPRVWELANRRAPLPRSARPRDPVHE
ncbi:helix-turn-helix domain-containing protein [Nocardia tengchongensis]|uniref:helix-turn-helix domain-containing protein n=1 Tax=Nocardia tengchongensis TaxID=2055889 RepID=UPI0036215E3F